MAKKPTIPCDRCGERFDYIPDECPNCGEIIRARMEPTFLERAEYLMLEPSRFIRKMKIIATIALFVGIITMGGSCFFEDQRFGEYQTGNWRIFTPEYINSKLPPPLPGWRGALSTTSCDWGLRPRTKILMSNEVGEFYVIVLPFGALIMALMVILYRTPAMREAKFVPQRELAFAGIIALLIYFLFYFPSEINGLILAICAVAIVISAFAALPPFYDVLEDKKAFNPLILFGGFAALVPAFIIRNEPVYWFLPHGGVALLFLALYFAQKRKWARYAAAFLAIAFFMLGVSYYSYCCAWEYFQEFENIFFSPSSFIARIGFAVFIIPLIYILMIDVYLIFARGKKKPKGNPVETPPNTD